MFDYFTDWLIDWFISRPILLSLVKNFHGDVLAVKNKQLNLTRECIQMYCFFIVLHWKTFLLGFFPFKRTSYEKLGSPRLRPLTRMRSLVVRHKSSTWRNWFSKTWKSTRDETPITNGSGMSVDWTIITVSYKISKEQDLGCTRSSDWIV